MGSLIFLLLSYADAMETGRINTQPVVIQTTQPNCLPCERMKKALQHRTDFIHTIIQHDSPEATKHKLNKAPTPYFLILYYTNSGYKIIGHGQVSTVKDFDNLLKASMKNVQP